jgi:hypothetical protein
MFKNWFCFHQYGLVNDLGFQYCSKCGKARFVKMPECKHVWYKSNTIEHSTFNRVNNYTYVLECSKCGDMKTFKLK